MYGVMAGQKQGANQRQSNQSRPRASPAPPREQKAEEKDAKKQRGFTEKIIDYIQKRFNPPQARTQARTRIFYQTASPQPRTARDTPLATPRPTTTCSTYNNNKRRLQEEECGEATGGAARHRPEPLSALAQSTRFSTHEIKLMYRGFKQECPSGVVDEESFKHIFSQFFPLGDASQYAHFVFNTIKHKQSGKINFEEFLEILSRVARGSVQEKLAWVFALYDTDGDGRISRAEMQQVVQAIYELLGRAAVPPASPAAAKDHVDRIFNLMDINADGVVTPDELARWMARDPAALRSLHTLDTIL